MAEPSGQTIDEQGQTPPGKGPAGPAVKTKMYFGPAPPAYIDLSFLDLS